MIHAFNNCSCVFRLYFSGLNERMETLTIFSLLLLVVFSEALDNGLGRTPPMGWNDWERYRCDIDCKKDPENCIGEKLFKRTSDLFVSEGYKAAGYQYVNIDDCWLSKERDDKRRLQPDPVRFPNGIKALADYIHTKGLKFGIYEDFGTHTCAGYPGSEYYLQMDAQTFADWDVDYLKFDGCYSNPSTYDDGYPPMAFFLNKTGRPIFFSTEYPLYQQIKGKKPNYQALAKGCNMARNHYDIDDSWDSLLSTIEFYGQNQYSFAEVAGPGFFNDPDMLIIGNYGLSFNQERVQMALWSIMAAPLMMSADLANMRPESKALLQNKGAIAVNQDPMGKQGKRITKAGNIQVWTRPVLPEGSYAFAFLNTGTGGGPSTVSIKLTDLGLNDLAGYNITEVFDGTFLGLMKPGERVTTKVNPTGVFFGKATKL